MFGYPGQDPRVTEKQGGINKEGPDRLKEGGPNGDAAGPVWAKNGSYLVIRRLRQDVAKFRKFLGGSKAQGYDAGAIRRMPGGPVKSGAPIVRRPAKDDPELGKDDCANNHFEFAAASKAIPVGAMPNGMCSDRRDPQSPGDQAGVRCPFASHIRKAYPRDDSGTSSPGLNEITTQTHRLLRRGIPFTDKRDRGLLFACYQTSIEEQFEFVTRYQINNPEFKNRSENGVLQSGHDLLIGQTNKNGARTRSCVLRIQQAGGGVEDITVTTDEEWVIPTGGAISSRPRSTRYVFSRDCRLG